MSLVRLLRSPCVGTELTLCLLVRVQHEFDLATGLAEDEQLLESNGRKSQSGIVKPAGPRHSAGSVVASTAAQQNLSRKKLRRKHQHAAKVKEQRQQRTAIALHGQQFI